MPFQDHGRKMRPSQMWHGGFFLPMAPHPVTSSRSILKKAGLGDAYPPSCPCIIRYSFPTVPTPTTLDRGRRTDPSRKPTTRCSQSAPWHPVFLCLDPSQRPSFAIISSYPSRLLRTLTRGPVQSLLSSSCLSFRFGLGAKSAAQHMHRAFAGGVADSLLGVSFDQV